MGVSAAVANPLCQGMDTVFAGICFEPRTDRLPHRQPPVTYLVLSGDTACASGPLRTTAISQRSLNRLILRRAQPRCFGQAWPVNEPEIQILEMTILELDRYKALFIAFGKVRMSLDAVRNSGRHQAKIGAISKLVPGRVENVARIISHYSIEITIETLAQAFGERRIFRGFEVKQLLFPCIATPLHVIEETEVDQLFVKHDIALGRVVLGILTQAGSGDVKEGAMSIQLTIKRAV